MIRTRTIQACTILLLGLAGAPAAQTPAPDEVDWSTPIRAHELQIAYYAPRWTPISALIGQANELYEQGVSLAEIGSPPDDPIVRNLMVLQEVQGRILVRGSRPQVEHLLGELARFDEAMGVLGEASASGQRSLELQEFEYAPRFLEASEVFQALERYRRPVTVQQPEGGRAQMINMTLLPGRGLILLKDTADNLDGIRAFLERLDVPAQQVTVHYLVLRGSSEPAPPGALPDELGAHLRSLMPMSHFHVEASGLLRGSTGRAMQVRLEDKSEATLMHLELDPSSFDPQSGTLTLRRCHFELLDAAGRRSFETSAALGAHEYTVVAAAGRDTVLLVLRLSLH